MNAKKVVLTTVIALLIAFALLVVTLLWLFDYLLP